MRIPPTSLSFSVMPATSRSMWHLSVLFAFIFLLASVGFGQSTDFDLLFVIGNINGQNGWMKTGPYDAAVSSSNSMPGFGAQSLRISNAITSGSFGDQTFSSSIANEAGETGAENGGMSGGTRQNTFTTEFSIASAQPGAEQPGLVISVSPDRGNGARMAYVRFEDHPDGIHVIFDDYIDAFPFGTTLHDPAGCSDSDYFREFLIATLDRSQPHTIKLVMHFYDGPRNDKVQVFVDGVLSATGTSWEDYFRYCEGHETRTVDSMIFRSGGAAAPGTSGAGFLFDNLTMNSDSGTVITATQADTKGWFVSSNTVGGQMSYINDHTAPSGNGALRLTTTDDDQSRAHYRRDLDTAIPLSSVTEASYYQKVNSGPAHAGASYALGVYLDGTSGSFTELVFEPYWNTGGPLSLSQHVWQKWDVLNGLQLWASQTVNAGGSCVTTAGSGGPPFYTIQGLQAACPNATVVYQKAYIGSYNRLYDVEVDLFSLNNTAYDFEPAAPTIVTVTQNDLTATENATDWLIYNDETDTIDNSLGSFVLGPGTVPYGAGSIQLSVTGTERKNIATYRFSGTPLADIDVLKFSTYNPSAGNGGGADNSGYLHFNVDFDASDTWQRRLIFLPADNDTYQSPVAQDTWQEWDAIAAGTALWRYSGATWPGSAISGETPKTWNQILSEYPGVRMRVTDSFFGIRVGEPYPAGYTENIDSVTFGTSAGTTVFNFDPAAPAVTVNHPLSQPDPTSTGPINFTATFSEPVSGFDASDVILSGPGSAGTSAVVTGGPTVYNIAVSGMSTDGQVIASIGAGAANSTVTSAPSAASTSTDNSVYFVATCNAVSIPTTLTSLTGVQVVVPINVDDLTGRSAFGYDATINYNPAVLSYVGIEQVGTLSSGLTIVPNWANPGTLSISAFSSTNPAMTGSGTLLNVRFQVIGAISGTASPITFSNFVFNEGNPCSTTANGAITIISGVLSGTVTYVNGNPTTPGVSNVNMAATGSGGNTGAITDSSGNYSISGFGPGSYTVTPSKAPLPLGSFNSAITNVDSTRIAQHNVGLITLNANQIIAGDVTGNGTVSNLDSTYIAQWKVGIVNPGTTGTWIFQPTSRSYANVNASIAGENYNGILKGDVSGNWNPTEAPHFAPTERPSKDAVIVRVGDVKATSGSDLIVPIDTTDLTAKGVTGYEFEVNFDPKLLEPAEVLADVMGTISDGRAVVANSPEDGRLLVVVYGVLPMDGKGRLINLHFRAIGKSDGETPIVLRHLVLNENEIASFPVSGTVRFVPNSDGPVIRGRLVSYSGDGISSARVTATDTRGRSYSVRSNSFGVFEVGNLIPGEVYIITIDSKGYRFPPRTVAAVDGAIDLLIMPQ